MKENPQKVKFLVHFTTSLTIFSVIRIPKTRLIEEKYNHFLFKVPEVICSEIEMNEMHNKYPSKKIYSR
jgi:hypothetical protein